MKIYHNPRCRKSRETLQMIKDAGIEPVVIEYLKTPPTSAELSEILLLLKVAPEAIVRKGEKLYKEQYKGKNLSDQDWLEILPSHPVLIERPIVVHQQNAVIGRPPENVKELL